MLRPGGFAVFVNPDRGPIQIDGRALPECSEVVELDTFSCGHCGAVRHVRPRERPEDLGGLCRQCMRPICPHCVVSGRCDPLEKKLLRAEARDRALRSYGL